MAKPVKTEEKKKGMTRAKAEKLIARTTDVDMLQSDAFAKHPNKHVRAKAQHKIGQLR